MEGALSGSLSRELELEYTNVASPYDELHTKNEFITLLWIPDGAQFERRELCFWESYLDDDIFLDCGFTESQLSGWTAGEVPSLDEYKIFLRCWIKYTFDNF